MFLEDYEATANPDQRADITLRQWNGAQALYDIAVAKPRRGLHMASDPTGEKYTSPCGPITVADCASHLRSDPGSVTIGTRLYHRDRPELARLACWDADNSILYAVLERAAETLYRARFRPYLETCALPADHEHYGGGKLWVLVSDWVRWRDLQATVHARCPELEQRVLHGAFDPTIGKPRKMETYPDGAHCVRLPCGFYRHGVDKPCEILAYGTSDDWLTGILAWESMLEGQTPADLITVRASETLRYRSRSSTGASRGVGVSNEQRFRRGATCPICGGREDDPRGRGVRCWGFVSDDGNWVRCTREEHAGAAPYNASAEAWLHRLYGPCRCGSEHNPAPRQRSKLRVRTVVRHA